MQCRDEFRWFNTFQFKALSFNTYNVGFINILRNKRVFYYCQTSGLFLYNTGIFSWYHSLQALYLSGTPSLTTGTRPPSCLHLNNRLYIYIFDIFGWVVIILLLQFQTILTFSYTTKIGLIFFKSPVNQIFQYSYWNIKNVSNDAK